MTPNDQAEPLTEDRRKAVFLAVVEAQDKGMSVGASRAEVAGRFEITEQQVAEIEREGLEEQWPPLS